MFHHPLLKGYCTLQSDKQQTNSPASFSHQPMFLLDPKLYFYDTDTSPTDDQNGRA